MTMARELDVSPWEALLLAVRLAAARVAWVDDQLRSTANAEDGNPTDHRVLRLLDESRRERRLLASTAKAAIDAGVAERVVRQIELEGKVLADALDAALVATGAGPEARLVALEAAHRHLTATMEPGGAVWGVPGASEGAYGASDDATDLDDDRGAEDGSSGSADPKGPPS
jgi:nucleotide-binding universal stress UspA family protein